MFNNLKKKIAEGVEGVNPGRQTPLKVSRARSQNNSSTPSTPNTTTGVGGGGASGSAATTPSSSSNQQKTEQRRSVCFLQYFMFVDLFDLLIY